MNKNREELLVFFENIFFKKRAFLTFLLGERPQWKDKRSAFNLGAEAVKLKGKMRGLILGELSI